MRLSLFIQFLWRNSNILDFLIWFHNLYLILSFHNFTDNYIISWSHQDFIKIYLMTKNTLYSRNMKRSCYILTYMYIYIYVYIYIHIYMCIYVYITIYNRYNNSVSILNMLLNKFYFLDISNYLRSFVPK